MSTMTFRKLFYLLFFISCTQTIWGINNSNSRFPISHTSKWRVDHIRNGVSNENKHIEGDEIFKYFIYSDTIIGARSYMKVFKSGVSYLNTPFYYNNVYSGAIRDEDNKFYFVKKNETSEALYYNFNAKVDDTIQVPYFGIFEPKIVSSIDTLPDGRKIIHFNPKIPIIGCGDQYIIEGIGGSGGLLEGPSCGHYWTFDNHLVCYQENGQLIFHDNNSELNCDIAELQDADQYIDSTCMWIVEKQQFTDTASTFEKLQYFISGDTVIQKNKYLRLFKSGYQTQSLNNGQYKLYFNDSVYLGALKSYNNKLFYVENGKNDEEMLYNFNLKTGDAADGKIFFGDTIKLIDTVLDNRKVYYFSDNHWDKRIYEGIGSDRGLLENNNENSYLVCFTKNSSPVYHDGSGTECIFNYSNLNFPDCDITTILPANPVTSDEIELIARFCYQVSKSNPYYPEFRDKKLTQNENYISIELFYDYNDLNASDNIKTVYSVLDTNSLGTLAEGYYTIQVFIHTIHSNGEKIDTVFNDKSLYNEFYVSLSNKIKPGTASGKQLKVYPVPAKETITLETIGSSNDIRSIEIYNILGNKIETIANRNAMNNKVRIDVRHLNKGIYILRVNKKNSSSAERIIVN
jgi:hypothetical protein